MSTYNDKEPKPKAIDVEIVPPERRLEGAVSFFHPLSGVAILLIDWVAFGIEAPSGLLLTGVASTLAFATAFVAIYTVQRRERGDTPSRARWKALLGALAAGAPLPIAGTAIGAAILILSGLPRGGGR